MKGKMRWKKNPAETGLRSVGAGPRGYVYHDGKTEYASVNALGGNWRGPLQGWYWCAPSNEELGIEWNNTATDKPYTTPEEAKNAAAEYVKACITKKENTIG